LDVLSALVQDRAWEWRWDMHPMWWMWGAGGIVMMVMMLAFWGVLIGGIVLAIRWMTRRDHTPVRDSALEILRERYARGEISREEFETRRRDLLG
jgi:putative membrane protein